MNRTHRDIPRARRARRAGVLAALAFAVLALVALVPPAAVAAAGGRSDDGLWTATFSAQDGLTQGADDLPAADDGTPRPLAYHVFAVNAAALGAALDAAPLEEQVAAAKSAAVITLPLPDGAFARYRLVESPILGPEVQKILPDMRTYLVQGLDDPTASGRLDYSSYGFHAMVHGQDGTLVIDPVNRGRTDLVLCAWERDFVQESEAAECVVREMEDQLPVGADKAIPPSGAQLREYRLALTGTDEYFCHFDPTGCTGATPKSDAAGVAAMTTTVNRVNSIYEKEASIRFIFTHLLSWWFPGGADPFPNGANTSLVLEENRTQTQAWPGEANFDVGHCFTKTPSINGVAYMNAACTPTYKGGGVSGDPTPSGDTFDVRIVCHELGHMFSSPHTWSNGAGCSGTNTYTGWRVEPGSGSTIMGYAGLCSLNVQAMGDQYFHVKSLEAIIAHRDATCGTIVATGNTPPVANAGADATIPRGTIFALVGNGTDVDGDELTYTWEQMDDGAPLFRSVAPWVGGHWRYMPDWDQLFSGAADPWEVLPGTDRTMHFRLVARDNRAGGGGVDDDDLVVTVAGDPFYVTSPNGGESFTAGQVVNATWSVGGGAVAPTVRIWLYSPDFGFVHVTDTANDGAEDIKMPCGLTSARCRLWVGPPISGDGAVFFDVSNADFTLTDGLPDWAFYLAPGWGDVVVVNSANSIALPTTLTGDTATYMQWVVGNFSVARGCGAFGWDAYIDGQSASSGSAPSGPPAFSAWGQGPAQPVVAGGRHTAWVAFDQAGVQPEVNESNNAYARQWVWSPPRVNPGAQQLRAHPPLADAGLAHVPVGVTAYTNRDGLRLAPGAGWWRAAAVSGTIAGQDVDIHLDTPSSGVEDGFTDTHLASSTGGGAYTDFVLSNGNAMGRPDYDVALVNASGETGQIRFEYRESDLNPLEVGSERARGLAEGQMLHLEELYVNFTEVGPITIELKNCSGTQEVTLALFGASFTEGSVFDAAQTVAVGGDGRAVINFNAPIANFYAVAVYRHAIGGTDPITFDLKLWRTPADLAAVTLPGSHAPVIPRASGEIPAGNPVPAPTQLVGDAAQTTLYHHFANLGPMASLPFTFAMKFDGAVVDEFAPEIGGALPGNSSTIYSAGRQGYNVAGGRHTLGYVVDSQDSNAELNELNNRYGEQWVWSPTQLAPGSAVLRAAPPAPDGGWGDVPVGATLYDNVDGVRSQTFNAPNLEDGYIGAVAVLPQGPTDVDLRLHAPSTGPTSGFDALLDESSWGGSSSDFVLIDFDGPHSHGQAWDAGIRRAAGEGPYAVQSTSSLFLAVDVPLATGPWARSIPAGSVIHVAEFGTHNGGGGAFRLHVRNLSGGADLGLSVFVKDDPTGYYNKSEAYAIADGGGSGQDEILLLDLPASAYYGVVVWKVGHVDLGLDSQFEIVVTPLSAVPVPDPATVPGLTRIEGVYPNPFNPQTTVVLAMSQAGPAAVRIYDVQGRLVRTLNDGVLAAGRHELPWNGVADDGRAVPSGVYFVRMVHGGGMDQQRMSLVK